MSLRLFLMNSKRAASRRVSSSREARLESARRRIVGKGYFIRERRELRRDLQADILRQRASGHRRNTAEHLEVTGSIQAVPIEMARRHPLRETRSFDEVYCFWSAVRGSFIADPYRWHYRSPTWQLLQGELVPEPCNEHDSTAVAIDLDGIRLGYIGARVAHYAHRHVATLRSMGYRVIVPMRVRMRRDSELGWPRIEAFAALPTFQQFDRLLPSESTTFATMENLWARLDPNVIEAISADQFHLSETTLCEIARHGDLTVKIGLPRAPFLQWVPRRVELFLAEKRHQYHSERLEREERQRQERDAKVIALYESGHRMADIAREISISSSTVSRILRDSGSRQARKALEADSTTASALALLAEGRSTRQIARELRISTQRVRSTLEAVGASLPIHGNMGINDYAREQMRARIKICRDACQLQRNGSTRKQISQTLGRGPDAVRAYLADGKFFDSPSAYPERLASARNARARGLTASSCDSASERRAIRDGNMLDLLGCDWISDSTAALSDLLGLAKSLP